MKDELSHSKNNRVKNNYIGNLFSKSITVIKDKFNQRFKNINSNEEEEITLEYAKKEYEELKAKKEKMEKHEDELLKYDDEIKDMDYCLIKSNDLNSVISCKKEMLSKRFFKYNNINIDNKAINALMFFDKENTRKIEEIISKLNSNELIVEKTYQLNKFTIEEICNLYISYEDKKYIVKNIEPFDKEIYGTLNEISSKYEEYHLQNKEIRDKFIKAFSETKYELNIASPWMNNYVVNDKLISMMERLLMEGVTIKIIYGIEENGSIKNIRKDNNKNINSDKIAEKLREKFKLYSDNFKIRKVNSHNKLLISDEQYYMETSFNLLSFSGEYDENSRDIRDEGATYSTNIEVIKDLRDRYFKF